MKAMRFAPQSIWIKSEQSGNTYICPTWVGESASEEDLERHCVSESDNPQNN